MRKVERDLALELKIVDMIVSGDNEMFNLGMALAEEYFDCYKKFQMMKDEGLLDRLMTVRKNWYRPQSQHRDWRPRGRILKELALKNEKKRRSYGLKDPRQVRTNDEW